MQIRLLFRALPIFNFSICTTRYFIYTNDTISHSNCELRKQVCHPTMGFEDTTGNKTLNFLYRYIAMSLLLAKYLQ